MNEQAVRNYDYGAFLWSALCGLTTTPCGKNQGLLSEGTMAAESKDQASGPTKKRTDTMSLDWGSQLDCNWYPSLNPHRPNLSLYSRPPLWHSSITAVLFILPR